jgi:hypothetical protein
LAPDRREQERGGCPADKFIIGVYGARLSEGFVYASASAPDAVFVFGR